ncbi:hypothetical protein YC2023_073547 [Brassica napus]
MGWSNFTSKCYYREATLKQELEEPALLGHVFHFGFFFFFFFLSKKKSEIALFSVDTSDQTQLCSGTECDSIACCSIFRITDSGFYVLCSLRGDNMSKF